MKFRYKVIIINIILLSLTLGIVGYILMERSYNLAVFASRCHKPKAGHVHQSHHHR